MWILLSVCLVAEPTDCREERIRWSFERAGSQACFVTSQQAIAEWQGSHPLWRVARWRCVARGSLPVDL